MDVCESVCGYVSVCQSLFLYEGIFVVLLWALGNISACLLWQKRQVELQVGKEESERVLRDPGERS